MKGLNKKKKKLSQTGIKLNLKIVTEMKIIAHFCVTREISNQPHYKNNKDLVMTSFEVENKSPIRNLYKKFMKYANRCFMHSKKKTKKNTKLSSAFFLFFSPLEFFPPPPYKIGIYANRKPKT